jgi:ABC-2 type transport system permease protein
MNFVLAVYTLWRREIVRFARQRSRIIGALATPFVIWFLIGSGLANSFQPSSQTESESYLQYSFAGILALIVMFTAIFSTISIIEDRQEGFLQSVLVAPVSRFAITLGKILGGTTLALVQALLFLLLAPTVGVSLSIQSVVALVVSLFLVGFALTALGFLFAWRMNSIQGFHAIMNLILMPMWLLSGAFFPPAGAPAWLRAIIMVNPLTYGVAALRRALYLDVPKMTNDLPSLAVCMSITILFGLLAFGATTWAAGRH